MDTTAQDMPHTPAPGSAERTAILDAAHAAVEQELGKSAALDPGHLNVLGDWAFIQATMQGKGGQPINYADTRFREAAAHGARSDVCMILLRRTGDTWTVETASIGPTDLAWADWSDRHGVPAALFPDL